MLALLKEWSSRPPVNEVLAILARAYTSWKPADAKPMSAEEAQAQHRASLRERWSAGALGPEFFAQMAKVNGKPSASFGPTTLQ